VPFVEQNTNLPSPHKAEQRSYL